jgi:hypothetical protein
MQPLAAAPRLVRSMDLHIRHQKQHPAAHPSDDRRNTSSRRPSTNNRIVRNDIRMDANARLPKTGVRNRPSGFGREQSEAPCWQLFPDRRARLSGAPIRPSGGRFPLEGDLQLPAPLVAPPELSGLIFYLFVPPPMPRAMQLRWPFAEFLVIRGKKLHCVVVPCLSFGPPLAKALLDALA